MCFTHRYCSCDRSTSSIFLYLCDCGTVNFMLYVMFSEGVGHEMCFHIDIAVVIDLQVRLVRNGKIVLN